MYTRTYTHTLTLKNEKPLEHSFQVLSKVCLDPFFFPLGCIVQVSYNKYVLVQQWDID